MTTDRPNNRTNYHSHCSFCDGKAPMEDFVEEAVRQGFAAYGISSHAPLPFPARWTLEAERMAAYLAEIDRLKAAYADRIELYAGLEIDYLNEQSNPASDYFQKLPLDYRIGSVHLIVSRGKYVDIDTDAETFAENLRLHFGDDLRKLVTDYFDKLMRMVSTGGFDFVGHADKIVYNASRCQPDIAEQPWYRQKIREYFETIARHGAMVEINTKKYHAGAGGVFFPNRSHFRLLRELRIPVLVNSDAHLPQTIDSGRREALAALQEAGIDTVMQLTGGRWQPTKIDLAAY